VQHRFVQELFIGAVPDAVMVRYLIQDHRFLDSFLVLLYFFPIDDDTDAVCRCWKA
jgi:thiaminase